MDIIILIIVLTLCFGVYKVYDILDGYLKVFNQKFEDIHRMQEILENRIDINQKRIDNIISWTKAAGDDLTNIKTTKDDILKVQSLLTVSKNLIEETRNHVKSFKQGKTTKTNKSSSIKKSSNTNTITASQRVKSDNNVVGK